MGIDAKLLDSLLAERKALYKMQDENMDKAKASRELSMQLTEDIGKISGKIHDHLDDSTK